jgi:hypothetical protein
MSNGTIIYNETIFQITNIRLKDGLIYFDARVDGPVTVPGHGEIRVHDPAGKLVLTAPTTLNPPKPVIASKGQNMVMDFPVRINGCTGWPRP